MRRRAFPFAAFHRATNGRSFPCEAGGPQARNVRSFTQTTTHPFLPKRPRFGHSRQRRDVFACGEQRSETRQTASAQRQNYVAPAATTHLGSGHSAAHLLASNLLLPTVRERPGPRGVF